MTASDKPTPISLNLDALEREGTPDPFSIVLGGRRIIMADAQEVDWQTLMASMSAPRAFFRLIVPPDDQAHFFAASLPTWKMRSLMNAYTEHYGLTDEGNPAALRT